MSGHRDKQTEKNAQTGPPIRKRIKQEISSDTTEPLQNRSSNAHNVSNEIQTNSYRPVNTDKSEMVKTTTQSIIGNISKRGFIRDADITEIFTDKQDRDMREDVIKKAEKLLKDVLGYKLYRDEESKRYYLAMNLYKGIEIAQDIIETRRGVRAGGSHDDLICAREKTLIDNDATKDCLLQLSLMFIFMTKRQTGSSVDQEKGVDHMLLKNFLDEILESFDADHLSSKQFGEWFGPAKSADFISQGWLRCDIHKDSTTGIDEVYYHWGSRAETVVNKKKLLETFIQIYGTKASDWPNHAKIAGIRG